MALIGNPIVSTDFPVNYFSGNGSTTAFTLSIAPASVNAIDVQVSGVSQSPQTYSVSGTTLTFSAAPPTGSSNIVVRHLGIAGIPNTPSAGSVVPSSIGTGYALWNLSGSDVNYTAGNVGIGTASPATKLTVNGAVSSIGSSSIYGIYRRDTSAYVGGWYAANGTITLDTVVGAAVNIDSSGNLLVGTTPAAGNTARGVFARASATSYYDGQLSLIATNSSNVLLGLGTPDNGVCIRKENGVNSIDAVNSNQTAWTNFRASAFSVQSDYRVKENITPIDNALNRVSQLNPVRFNYAEGSMAYTDGKLVDGFIAHEVAEVVPEAVIGTKDEVKEDGTPLYQSLDQAKLIPIMVKAIQELKAELDATKAEVAALKAAA